jgi:hypothetical protein
MKSLNNRIIYLIPVFVALIHSLKLSFIPELNFFILLTTAIFFINKPYYFILVFTIILSTHFYAIPDANFRFNAFDYPSIYTKEVFGIKYLDLSIVIIFLYGVIQTIRRRSLLKPKFLFLIIIVPFIGLIRTFSLPEEQISYIIMLFQARNVLLVFGTYLILTGIDLLRLRKLCYVAITSWIATMFFAIIFPADNPLYREILGITWNIYFAGDEYLSLGVYACAIMLICRCLYESKNQLKKNSNLIIFLCLVSWTLALISQRLGSIPYFIVVILIIYISTFKFLENFYVKLYLFFGNFLNLLINSISILSAGSFSGLSIYSELLNVSILSLQNMFREDIFSVFFGIGLGGLYEIIGLTPVLDNPFSFGNEVGEKYRYVVWSIPFGRILFGSGLFGFFTILGINLSYIFKKVRAEEYYLIIYIIGLIFWVNMTPVSALPMGFALSICSIKDIINPDKKPEVRIL